jgi:hypothetical protein
MESPDPVVQRVAVGFFSFTEVPARAHRAYNAWHQFDHLPEQYRLPGIAHGERWVASPDCVAARIVDDDLLGGAQYLTLYLIGAPVDETLRRFRELAGELRALGRFHEERTAHLFGGWRLAAVAGAPGEPVTAAAIPWRPSTGVFVLVEGDDPGTGDVEPLEALEPLVSVQGVVGGWMFRPSDDLTHPSWRMRPYRITVLWLDDDPPAVAHHLAPRLPAAIFAGPYRAITPGDWGWFD